MTARVLVVDDVPANVKLLEARLSAEYFDVTTAHSGAEALTICERAGCDLVHVEGIHQEAGLAINHGLWRPAEPPARRTH